MSFTTTIILFDLSLSSYLFYTDKLLWTNDTYLTEH